MFKCNNIDTVTFKDNDGILKVKAKITERDNQEWILFSILLPDKCKSIKILIRSIDQKNCQSGIRVKCVLDYYHGGHFL